MCDATDDARLWVQATAIGREIDVNRIVVGGDEYRWCRLNPRCFQVAKVRRIPHYNFVTDPVEHITSGVCLLQKIDWHLLLRQCLSSRHAHGPSSNNEDRVGIDVVCRQSLIELGQFGLRSHHHCDAVVGEQHFRASRHQNPAFPHPNNTDADLFSKAGISYALPGQRRVVNRELCDIQTVIAADFMEPRLLGVDTIGELFAKPTFEGKHMVHPSKRQNINRVFIGRNRRNRNFGSNLAHRQGDVCVQNVIVVGEHQQGLVGANVAIRFGIVKVAHDYFQSVGVCEARQRRVGLDQHIGNAVSLQPCDESGRNGIAGSNDHVALHIVANFARHPKTHLFFEPGGVQEADERKRQHGEQQDHTRQQDDHAKEAANIGVKGDVSKAQRGHHHHHPVQPRNPRVILAFVDHDEVEKNGEDKHHCGDQGYELHQSGEISFDLLVVHQVGEMRSECLHHTSFAGTWARTIKLFPSRLQPDAQFQTVQ